MSCELMEGCIFFRDEMPRMPATAEGMKDSFCRRTFQECARYRVCKALGRASVPRDLMPRHMDRARQIIDSAYPQER